MRIARKILDKLPDWFGIPESTAQYVAGCAELPFWAEDESGFIAMRQTGKYAAEIFVMGVIPECHRKGIGRRLFEALRDGDLLKESHDGGCVLYEKKEQVKAILKGES